MRPEDAASWILNGFWDLSLPVNPIAIANKMGIKVFMSPDLGDLGGYYDEKERKIVVNKKDTVTRQRFSVAHELGHCVLGHGSSPRRNDIKYSRENYKTKEVQANTFAAELLMPKDPMKVMVEMRGFDFENLCKTFDVSPQSMGIRLATLGYV